LRRFAPFAEPRPPVGTLGDFLGSPGAGHHLNGYDKPPLRLGIVYTKIVSLVIFFGDGILIIEVLATVYGIPPQKPTGL